MSIVRPRREPIPLPSGVLIASGAHGDADGPCCVVELENKLLERKHGDHAVRESVICGDLLRRLNDSIPDDAERTALMAQFLGRLSNTKGDQALERRRFFEALDWSIRDDLPRWLGADSELGKFLAALPKITDLEILKSSMTSLRAAGLSDAGLSDAVLRDAVLRDAVLRDAVLSDAVLRDAVLRDAVLSAAVLSDAVLSAAVLRDAVLRDAVLSEKIKAAIVPGDYWATYYAVRNLLVSELTDDHRMKIAEYFKATVVETRKSAAALLTRLLDMSQE